MRYRVEIDLLARPTLQPHQDYSVAEATAELT